MPYSKAARSAATKLHALLPPATVIGVGQLRSRLRVQPAQPAAAPLVLAVLEQAVTDNTAVRLRYTDRNNTATPPIDGWVSWLIQVSRVGAASEPTSCSSPVWAPFQAADA